MPIPETELFDRCLGSFTLNEPSEKDNFDKLEVVPTRILSEYGEVRSSAPVWMWHPKSCPITLPALARRVCDELQRKQHLASAKMARALLAILCLLPSRRLSAAARLNALLQRVGTADVSHFLIAPFPPHPDSKPFELGRFLIGPLARERLVYRCLRVECDFFNRYPRQFLNRFAIEGSPVPVQLLDWPALRDDFRIAPSELGSTLVDYYFELLSQHEQAAFRDDFRQAQEVPVAAGAPYTDLDDFQAWNGGSFICVYQNIGSQRRGYFCPLGMGIQINFAQADVRVPRKVDELRERFSFTGLGPFEIHRALGTFSRFVMRAKVHEGKERLDEAFLHYVIALDLLFGEKDASTQRTTKRTGIVVARALGTTYGEVVGRLKAMYDKRSRYVHMGASACREDIDAVRPVISAVLRCLLRLQSVGSNRQDGFVGAWLKNLDFLVAATEADKPVSDEDLLAAGIALQRED